MKILTSIVLFFTILYCCLGWSSTQHMIIFQIALNELSPEKFNLFNATVSYMQERDLNYAAFIELACMPDDLKGWHLNEMNTFHFYDQLFYDGIDPSDSPLTIDYNSSVVYVTKNIIETMKTKIFKPPFDGKMERSFMLKFLPHFVGDLHQPLHETSRVTKNLIMGDAGGNLFPISFGRITNLHALWDQTMNQIDYIQRPISPDEWDKIKEYAKNFTTQYTRKSLQKELADKDVDSWGKYVHQFALSNSYVNITEKSRPSNDYLNINWEVCKKLMVLAGYRLTDLLNELLSDPKLINDFALK